MNSTTSAETAFPMAIAPARARLEVLTLPAAIILSGSLYRLFVRLF